MSPALLAYETGGAPVQLLVGDRDLVPSLKLLFPQYKASPLGAAPGRPAMTVERSDRGWIVAESGVRHDCRTVIEVAEAIEFALTQAFLGRLPAVAQAHAAAAVFPRGAVLLLGGEGAGKTSLAFCLSRLGHPVLGDDVTLVVPGGRARAFKRLFKVDPAVLMEAGVPPESTRLWEPEATTAWYDPAESGGWAEEAPVAAVGILRRAAGTAARVRPVSRSTTLNALMHSLLPTGAHGPAAFDILATALRDAVTFELDFADAATGVRALETLMR